MNNAMILKGLTPLQKADIAVADLTANNGGLLLPAPAKQFIQDMIVRSTLMPLATVKPMTAQNDVIPRIGFGEQVLHPSQEATALPAADRSKPTFSGTPISTKEFKGEVRIPDAVLEDNIERDGLKSTVMQLMSKAVARDLENLAVNGDTASSNDLLRQFNGALKLAQSHVVDAGSAMLNRSVLKDMIKSLPQVYKDDRRSMTFLTSTNATLDLADNLGNRQTPGGDNLVFDGDMVKYQGIPVRDVAMMPDNLGIGANTTNVLLLNPKNLTIGIWRDIRIETARDISSGVTIIVVTIRIGVQYALEDAIVKATNVKTAA